MIDEPVDRGGADLGPSPTRAAAAGLAACTAITCEMYAAHKGWELGAVECTVEIEQGKSSNFEEITVTLKVPETLDDEQRDRLLVIAGKCPVHRALAGRGRGRDPRPDRDRLMDLGLAGRACAVTGASRGIGRATARHLVAEAASVLLVARGAEDLAEAAEDCREYATGDAGIAELALDVTDPRRRRADRRHRRGALRQTRRARQQRRHRPLARPRGRP